jgi:hypothetical protein
VTFLHAGDSLAQKPAVNAANRGKGVITDASQEGVDSSMSLNRNVTVPVGSRIEPSVVSIAVL